MGNYSCSLCAWLDVQRMQEIRREENEILWNSTLWDHQHQQWLIVISSCFTLCIYMHIFNSHHASYVIYSSVCAWARVFVGVPMGLNCACMLFPLPIHSLWTVLATCFPSFLFSKDPCSLTNKDLYLHSNTGSILKLMSVLQKCDLKWICLYIQTLIFPHLTFSFTSVLCKCSAS